MIQEKQNEKKSLMQMINPTPKQKMALALIKKFKYFLYGGAMGGGKSYLIRWALVALLVYYYKRYGLRNVTVGLFCEDYPALKDRHINKIQYEFPEWLGTLNKADHEFKLRPEYGGGILALRNLDDPSKYASAEFAAVAVDELTKNVRETFDFIRTRMRWPGLPGHEIKFFAGTNPGSKGHAWVKKMFIDRIFDPNEQEADQFMYLKALASDNPHIDEAYEKVLASLPEKLKRAFKEGDWDIFVGQYFSEWRREYNVCEPYTLQPHFIRFLSIDYGHAHPSAVYWGALDNIGRVIVYRELHEVGLTYSKLARKIQEMTPVEEQKMLEGNMVADPAIFSKKGENDQEKSGDEIMFDATNGWLSLRRANNDRVIGWGIMREYMKAVRMSDDMLTSKLIFFSTCVSAILTIPALVHSSTVPEDVEKKSDDDDADSMRYMLMDIYETFSKKEEEKPTEVKTVEQRFKNDMYWEKKNQEEERLREETQWMDL